MPNTFAITDFLTFSVQPNELSGINFINLAFFEFDLILYFYLKK
jgi:hypothetical protein